MNVSRLREKVLLPLAFALNGTQVERELELLRRTEWYSAADLRKLQDRKLRVLLHHAYQSVPYYRECLNGLRLHPSDIAGQDQLTRLPLLDKSVLGLRGSHAFLSKAAPRRCFVRRTSGTSGHPTTIYADPLAQGRSLAARYRSTSWHGIGIGAREARFWGSPSDSKGRYWTAGRDFLLNRRRVPAGALTREDFERSLRRLERFQPDYFYGYTSLMVRFAEFVSNTRRSHGLRPKAVIATAEPLHQFQRGILQQTFATKVLSEYGCSETDIIAFECPAGQMHVIAENVLVEVLDDGVPTAGVGEIVVTDLNNTLMPLLRYRLGDRGRLSGEPCSCGRHSMLLMEIQGRQGQYIRTPEGRHVHCVFFAYLVERSAEDGLPILQFRVVQETVRDLRLLLVSPNSGREKRTRNAGAIRSAFDREFGPSMRLEIEFVDEIPAEMIGEKYSYFESRLSHDTAADA